jgi:predicted dehydrogenase
LKPVHLCFLGCGFITRVHSRHLQKMRSDVVCSYASRDPARAAEYQRRFGGVGHYGDYDEALRDPAVDAVVVALPTRYHLELTLRALEMGKHVLVEKPAFPNLDDYHTVIEARARTGRVVLVGENDHYNRFRAAPTPGRRRHRRAGVRALRHHHEEAQIGRRLAQ